jgi:ATP-dependent RNA helicase RhlE
VTFRDFKLDSCLLPAIAEAGYREPTPIQSATIPPALAGSDLIGTAQTGTGKTAAFVLPILNKLLRGPRGRVRTLIITPTRELAMQIDDVIKTFSRGTPLRSATVFGGVSAGPQLRAFREGVEILVACPGRLLDHLGERHVDLSGVEILVLDEADRMLDMGFLPDVSRILRVLPTTRQTLLFSATFPRQIQNLAEENMREPKRIAVGVSRPAQTVAHAIYPVAQHLKTALLLDLLHKTDTESVLVFARTKHRAQRVARQVGQAGYSVTSLHGDRTQGQRQAALRGFRTGEYQIMVATDIAARGLDIEGISHVINYDMPDTVDAYIHRIGRTGRAARTGDAFTLVTSEDGLSVEAIERVLGGRLERATLRGFDYQSPKPARTHRPVKPVNVGRRTARGPRSKTDRVASSLSWIATMVD